MIKILFSLTVLTLGLALFLSTPQVTYAANSGPAYPYSLQVMPGKEAGTVDLKWLDDSTSNRYDLTYGTDSAANMWGVQNINENQNSWTWFTVKSLNPGTTYYFSLVAKNGDQYIAKTGPVSTMATSGQVMATPPAVQQVSINTSSGPTGKYSFKAQKSQKSGSVDVSWVDDGSANQYDLVYGTEPGKYMWGVQNISEKPNTTNMFTVMALQPGVRYYFALVPEVSGTFVEMSSPVSAVAR